MIKDKKTKKIEVRLTENEYKFFKLSAYSIGSTPSELVRMFINSTVNQIKIKVQLGEISLEDYETIFDDKL